MATFTVPELESHYAGTAGYAYPRALNPWPTATPRKCFGSPDTWVSFAGLVRAMTGKADTSRVARGMRQMVSLGVADGCTRTTPSGETEYHVGRWTESSVAFLHAAEVSGVIDVRAADGNRRQRRAEKSRDRKAR